MVRIFEESLVVFNRAQKKVKKTIREKIGVLTKLPKNPQKNTGNSEIDLEKMDRKTTCIDDSESRF